MLITVRRWCNKVQLTIGIDCQLAVGFIPVSTFHDKKAVANLFEGMLRLKKNIILHFELTVSE